MYILYVSQNEAWLVKQSATYRLLTLDWNINNEAGFNIFEGANPTLTWVIGVTVEHKKIRTNYNKAVEKGLQKHKNIQKITE